MGFGIGLCYGLFLVWVLVLVVFSSVLWYGLFIRGVPVMGSSMGWF